MGFAYGLCHINVSNHENFVVQLVFGSHDVRRPSVAVLTVKILKKFDANKKTNPQIFI